jgi:hypothetical protein
MRTPLRTPPVITPLTTWTKAQRMPVPELEADLAQPAAGDVFGEDELNGLPAPVQRYFRASIALGTPLALAARIAMQGSIKIAGRWMPFRATEVLAPHRGFVWSASVAGGLFAGSDQYASGLGAMRWKILGLIPVVQAEGPDVSHSAAARAGAESVWVPTALLPRFGVNWTADDDTHLTARYTVDNTPLVVRYELDEEARIVTAQIDRWGDPNNTGAWGMHPFGFEATARATFDGVSVPSQGRVGWFPRTEQWADGEFFRFALTELRLVTT